MGLEALFVITEWDGGSLAPREAEQKQLLQRSGHRALLQGQTPCWLAQELHCTHHEAAEATGVLPLFMLCWWG